MKFNPMRGVFAGAALSFAVSVCAAPSAPSDDAPYAAKTFACPIGGQAFEQRVDYPGFALVQFPDGSWLGDHLIDAQVPECPKDGLVLIPDFDTPTDTDQLAYRTYTPEQVAKLTTLVGSDAYRALRKRGRYERAEWIGRQLDLSPFTKLELLMRASWATVNAADRKRLVERLATEGPTLIAATTRPELEKLALRLRVANALREIGRFDEADAELDSIAAAIPADADLKDPDAANGIGSVIASLHEAIAVRDDDRFPVGLVSDRWASQMCNGQALDAPYGPLTANARAACKRREKHRQALDDEYASANELLRDPKVLEQRCAATPEGKREPGLANACRSQQYDRDHEAGEALLANHPEEVAAQCEATSPDERNGPVRAACSGYQSALEFALDDLLVDDDAAYSIICLDGRQPEDRAGFASMACSSAERTRNERAVAKRMADTVALDADCAATPQKDRELILYMACSERARALDDLAAERLVADPAAYRAKCAAFDAQRDDMTFRTDYSEAELLCSHARMLKERASQQHDAPPRALPVIPPGLYSADSALSKVALEYARKVVAKAKVEKTYPKRKRGDLY